MSHPLVTQIGTLPLHEQTKVYRSLQPWLVEMERLREGGTTVTDIRESRFAAGLICPRCGSDRVKRNGRFKDKSGYTKQRYLCRGCGRAFNDLTGTPLAYSKHQTLWARNARCMVEGMSVRKTAVEVGVSARTAFRWRHKVLAAFQSQAKPTLNGIVEADEMFFLHSEKGNRELNRPGRKRGGKARRPGLSKEQVCVITAQDRQGHSVAEIAGRGLVNVADIEGVLGGVVKEGAKLCTDGAAAYPRFCREQGIEHVRIDTKRLRRGSIYHINRVNNWQKRFRDWHDIGLRGVASKYLDGYMAWFIVRDRVSKVSPLAAAKQLLSTACA